jgi:hypothetical protein
MLALPSGRDPADLSRPGPSAQHDRGTDQPSQPDPPDGRPPSPGAPASQWSGKLACAGVSSLRSWIRPKLYPDQTRDAVMGLPGRCVTGSCWLPRPRGDDPTVSKDAARLDVIRMLPLGSPPLRSVSNASRRVLRTLPIRRLKNFEKFARAPDPSTTESPDCSPPPPTPWQSGQLRRSAMAL